MSTSMVNITIDGETFSVANGQNLLCAALDNGIQIPHFCYHPALEVAGNCRMCLVEVDQMAKLQISCATAVRDGLIVHTKSEKVLQARAAVMEFLLINHPLDCPICDQCGECILQDHSFDHGLATSRYHEPKRTYEKKNLGELVVPEMTRCIHCTRCIRFLRDVAGSEEMALTERGEHTEVGSYLATSLTSPFSMNVIDLCPVGALTSGPFRFKARPWMMEKVRTICPGCSRGCNATASIYRGKLYRLQPVENLEVNDHWLCDQGRLDIGRVESKDRLREPLLDRKTATLPAVLDAAARHIKNDRARTAIIVTGQLTNEDLLLIKKLGEVIGKTSFFRLAAPVDDRPFGPLQDSLPAWFIRADSSPNSQGVELIFGSAIGSLDECIAAIKTGAITTLLMFGIDLAMLRREHTQLGELLGQLDFSLYCHTHAGPLAMHASGLIPMTHWYERDGTAINENRRLQRLQAALPTSPAMLTAWQVAAELSRRLGVAVDHLQAQEVYDAFKGELPGYGDIDFNAILLDGIAADKVLT